MKVIHREELESGHSIEIGWSSWNDSELSVRDRYDLPSGKFTPHNSSEVPLKDLAEMYRVVCNYMEQLQFSIEPT